MILHTGQGIGGVIPSFQITVSNVRGIGRSYFARTEIPDEAFEETPVLEIVPTGSRFRGWTGEYLKDFGDLDGFAGRIEVLGITPGCAVLLGRIPTVELGLGSHRGKVQLLQSVIWKAKDIARRQ